MLDIFLYFVRCLAISEEKKLDKHLSSGILHLTCLLILFVIRLTI